MPGAFADFLAANGGGVSVPVLWQHDSHEPIGVWSEMAEDGKGLQVSGKLANTPRGQEIYSLMKMEPRPAIDGLSIGYIPKEFEMRSKPEDPRRRLKRVDLLEISPVTFPANGKARVGEVKSIEELASMREIEEYLSAQGLSKTQAVALIARIKGIGPGDPGDVKGGPGDPVAELMASLRRRQSALPIR